MCLNVNLTYSFFLRIHENESGVWRFFADRLSLFYKPLCWDSLKKNMTWMEINAYGVIERRIYNSFIF